LTTCSKADPPQIPEALLTTAPFKDAFVDRLLAEAWAEAWAEVWTKGYAKGMAQMLLRILWARRVWIPAQIRKRVLSCTDISQLEAWGRRAANAAAVDDVFGD
jgi:hypothetical protein